MLFPVTQNINAQQASDFGYYKMLNDNKKRLYEYRDDDNNLRLKLIQLDIINKSRKRHNAPPVKLDILASRVANMMSREAAENGYISHWNMKGEKPYHRYAFAGDMIMYRKTLMVNGLPGDMTKPTNLYWS